MLSIDLNHLFRVNGVGLNGSRSPSFGRGHAFLCGRLMFRLGPGYGGWEAYQLQAGLINFASQKKKNVFLDAFIRQAAESSWGEMADDSHSQAGFVLLALHPLMLA